MGKTAIATMKPGRSEPTDPALLDSELERLATLDLAQLRVQFRNRTGRIAPARISRPLLLQVLAYRMQAEIFGDLRPDTRRLLDRIKATAEVEGGTGGSGGSSKLALPGAADRPRTGTVLVREWRGRMHHVMVLADGFAWNGATQASLSAVAFAITGTRWNGRRFFGLDRQVQS